MPDLAVYHVTSRVVHRQLLFAPEAREEFCKFMRLYEHFSGCLMSSYWVMTNHFHLILEAPALPGPGPREGGEVVGGVELRLSKEEQKVIREFRERTLKRIFERCTKRMHNLSLFMKGHPQRLGVGLIRKTACVGFRGRNVFTVSLWRAVWRAGRWRLTSI